MIQEEQIPKIKNGVVIDHIPAQSALKMIRTIKITDGCQLRIGVNFISTKMGSKDVVKIENQIPTKKDLNKISLFAPNATVSVIENYKLKEKLNLEVPKLVESILECANPNCITRHEVMDSSFELISKIPLKFKCHYCEKIFDRTDLEVLR